MDEGEKAAEEHSYAVGHKRGYRVFYEDPEENPSVGGAEDGAYHGKLRPGEEADARNELFRAFLKGKNGNEPEEADPHAEPFAPVHLLPEVDIREESREEGAEAIDKTNFSAGQVLQAPEFKGVGQVHSEYRKEAE